jgi:lysophospholipase L1-like esterase
MNLINRFRTETFFPSDLISDDQIFISGLLSIIFCVILAIVYFAFKRFQHHKRCEEKGLRPPKIGTAKVLVINISIFVTLFFIIEGWVTIVYPEGRGYLGKFFEYDSYAIWKQKVRGKHIDSVHWPHISNNLGLRRVEDTKLQKPKGTYRIIFMGGSAAWGLNSGRATIDFFLEKLIQKDFPNTRIEVLNASAVGYKSYQHVIRYNTFLRFLDPDMVIVMDGHNDFYKIYDPTTEFYDNQYSKYLWPIYDKSLTATALIVARNLGEFSNAFNLLFTVGATNYSMGRVAKTEKDTASKIISNYNLDTESGFDQFKEDYTQSFKSTIVETYRTFHASLALHNIDFVISSQPELVLRNKRFMTSSEKSYNDWFLAGSRKGYAKEWEAFYKVFPGILQEATDEMSNTTYLNLQELTKTFLGKSLGLLADYCHPGPEGSKYIAEIFYSHIKDTLKRKIGNLDAKGI